METRTIGLIIISTITALIILAFLAGAVIWVNGDNNTNEPRYKVTCSGTIKVDLFGIGRPDLEPPRCYRTKCSLLTFSLIPGWLGEEGNIKLIIDGTVHDSMNWRSKIGENIKYTLNSACINNPQLATIALYNDGRTTTKDVPISIQG